MTPTNMDMPSHLLKDVINPWLLGADPEFVVLTPPDTVVANAGQNAVNTTKAAGEIGSDHNGRVWELRPSPSPSAYVVAINLWKLLQQAEMERVAKFKWKSGGLGGRKQAPPPANLPTTFQGWVAYFLAQGYNQANAEMLAHSQLVQQQHPQVPTHLDTLGGHVHFGVGGFNPAQRTALNDITTGLLNLDVLPHKENEKRLAITAMGSPKYGHFSGGDAVRDCQGHMEYRCAPSWLDRPGQALAALTCYKLAAARPSALKWPKEYAMKQGMLEWLEELSSVDVDAWILSRFIESRGFESIQADPEQDFKPLWRRDNPLEK